MRIRCLARFSLLTAMLVASCRACGPKYTVVAPGVDIPEHNVNTLIKLEDLPILRNSHRNNQTLTLNLISSVNSAIVFPENFGVRVLRQQNGSWMDVQNNFYNARGPFVLPPKAEAPGGFILAVLPYIPGLSSQTNLRVLVVGHVNTATGEAAAAYIDVLISP